MIVMKKLKMKSMLKEYMNKNIKNSGVKIIENMVGVIVIKNLTLK